MYEEVEQIPEAARLCYEKNKKVKLPEGVPYLGMGASYYAPLTLWYAGKDIKPFIASEYFLYQGDQRQKKGVLISQSGESSEVLWNAERFKEFVAVTNNPDSSLAKARNCKRVVELYAGQEEFVSTKTYFNTLIALYLGLEVDPEPALEAIENQFSAYKGKAELSAEEIAQHINQRPPKGFFVLGSGSNVATAMQGALTLSESTKFVWQGLSVAQYDHGPKETAQDSVVLFLQSNGKDAERISYLEGLLEDKSNALVREIATVDVAEELSPFCHIVQLNLLMVSLANKLGEQKNFLGEKVTRFQS